MSHRAVEATEMPRGIDDGRTHLDERRSASLGAPMSWRIERDDCKTAFQERLDEGAELAPATFPSVHQEYAPARVPPGPGGNPASAAFEG
jgi:hypothetical protein